MVSNWLMALCFIVLGFSLFVYNPIGILMMAFIIGMEVNERMPREWKEVLNQDLF